MARHAAEGITKNLWFAIIQLVLYQFVMPDVVNTMSALFLRLPFSRRYVYHLLLSEFSKFLLLVCFYDLVNIVVSYRANSLCYSILLSW